MTEIERRAPSETTQDRRIREDLTSFQKIIAKVGYGLMAGMAAILVKLVFFP